MIVYKPLKTCQDDISQIILSQNLWGKPYIFILSFQMQTLAISLEP